MFKHCIIALGAVVMTFVAAAASAHISLEVPSAPAGSTYKAVFGVGHGCQGSATTAITVFLPQGFASARPMPKPGWTLEIAREKADASVDSGMQLVRVSWRGGKLPDDQYDEFVMRLTIPDVAGKRAIRVLQQCESGENDWAGSPADASKPLAKPALPAPVLEVTPASGVTAHHH